MVDIAKEIYQEEIIDAIQGRLLMVSFHTDACGILLDNGTYLSNVTFDDDTADVIETALRKDIYAVGIATLNAETRDIEKFHIKRLIVLTPDVSSDELDQVLRDYREENDTLANFRQGWKEAISGQTHPISELWDGIDAE